MTVVTKSSGNHQIILLVCIGKAGNFNCLREFKELLIINQAHALGHAKSSINNSYTIINPEFLVDSSVKHDFHHY